MKLQRTLDTAPIEAQEERTRMEDGLFIIRTTLHNVERVVERAMATKVGPLAREVQELRDQIRQTRRVITHKIAPLFFDDEVKPETVIDYIKHRGLPAYKNGRKWYIYLDDLMDWQIGLIGSEERTTEITIVAPRYDHLDRAANERPYSQSAARGSSSAHHQPRLNEPSSRRPESS